MTLARGLIKSAVGFTLLYGAVFYDSGKTADKLNQAAIQRSIEFKKQRQAELVRTFCSLATCHACSAVLCTRFTYCVMQDTARSIAACL